MVAHVVGRSAYAVRYNRGMNNSVRLLQAAAAQADRLDKWLARKVQMRFNVLAQRVEIFEEDREVWRELRDVDATDLSYMYFGSTGNEVSSFRVHETLRAVAYKIKYDPLKEHLLALPDWDRTPRLDSWLASCIGAEQTEYTKIVGHKWLLAAIARALSPGCKVDGVLILHGKQGVGKSTLLRDLATDQFFSEADFDFSRPQEAGMALRGCWIHEWAELDNMSRATHTRLKAFISETRNVFRPPYGRETIDEPRRCIFAGSSNKDDFLTDTTGNRRFWPVKVGKYDQDLFLKMRDQLLAEALLAYQADEMWWLTPEEEALAEAPRSMVEHEDPWTGPLRDFLDGRAEVTVIEALEALSVPLERVDIRAQARVAGILRRLGYFQNGRVNGKRSWTLVRP